MNMENTSDYLSNTLFHFWGKGMDEQHQLKVFDSVIQNGLLLTCGNKDFIDQFQFYRYSSKQVEHLRLRQWARVCFTEVPRDKLSLIQEKFGSFGIGFSRKNILRWGGCPVWYLPNYFEQETQYGRMAISLTHLTQLIDLLKSMKDKNSFLTVNGKDLSPLDSAKMLDKFIGTIYFYASHFKEMSTKIGDDQSFLYEKEWRIVHGFHYGPSRSLFRRLTPKEKEVLISDVSSWAQPYQTGIPEIKILLETAGKVGIVGVTEIISKNPVLWPIICRLNIELMRKIRGCIDGIVGVTRFSVSIIVRRSYREYFAIIIIETAAGRQTKSIGIILHAVGKTL